MASNQVKSSRLERIDRGEYRLKRKERRRNEGLVKLLLACPVKGWFKPLDRKQTTDDIKVPRLACPYLVDANVLSEPTKPVPSMIAATALQHDLTVAMRNNREFNKTDVQVLNPFA